MSLNLIQKGRKILQQVSEGVQLDGPWYNRNGATVMTPVEQAWAEAGRVFTVNAGTGTSPIPFGAGTIDTTEPDLDFEVPAGASFMVVPLEIHIQMEAFGTTAIFEGMASIGLGGVFGTTGGSAVTPVCLRTDRPNGASGCRAISNVDGSGATYMTSNVAEIFRFGIEAVATVGTGDDDSNRGGNAYLWAARDRGVYPVMVASGGLVCRLNVFACSQAGTGFIRFTYAELPLS